MASFSFPSLPSPVITTLAPPAPVAPVAPLAPVALLQAELDALPLPTSQPAPTLPAPGTVPDGAAMRPDQVMMARQMTWPSQDGATLAGNWRGMVRNYGAQVANRQQQVLDRQVPAALLQSAQFGTPDTRLPQPSLASTPFDAWRFTVHAGDARDQYLRVVHSEPEQQHPRQRRRRGRAALRLELVLADGSIATVQAEPVADGIMIEVCAPEMRTLLRLQELQPRMEAAIRESGLRVLGWKYRDTLPDGRVHARLPSLDAVSALSLPVFRAVAELALLLPAPDPERERE